MVRWIDLVYAECSFLVFPTAGAWKRQLYCGLLVGTTYRGSGFHGLDYLQAKLENTP